MRYVVSLLFLSLCSFCVGCGGSIPGMGGSIAGLTDVADIADVTESGDLDGVDMTSALGAGVDLYKAASLTDEEVIRMSKQAAKHFDSTRNVASKKSVHSARLAEITDEHRQEDGLDLNFKVYIDEEVNAFALADGSIRVHSGLMDMMNDDEVRSVIGHEIGHVKLGHSKKEFQVAYTTSAAAKAAMSVADSPTGVLSTALLSDLVEKLVSAQYSQSQEIDSDAYGLRFLKKHRYEPAGAVTSLSKLAELGADHGIFSSHPAPEKRAKILAKEIGEGSPAEQIQVAAKSPASDETSDVVRVDPDVSSDEKVHTMKVAVAHSDTTPTVISAESTDGGNAFVQGQGVQVSPRTVARTNSHIATGWYIQVNSYGDHLDAEIRASELNTNHLGVHLARTTTNKKRLTHVLVGPFYEKEYAERNLVELEEDGMISAPATIYLIER